MCLSLLLNIMLILPAVKEASRLSFCSKPKMYVLIVLTVEFVFKIIRPIIFSAVKKVSFPQSKEFSLIEEFFHSQGNFPPKHFTWSRKFSTNRDVFHDFFFFFDQRNFPQTKNFSTSKNLFFDQGSFPQTNTLTQSKISSAKKDQKDSLKAKNLDPFNTISYAKIFFNFLVLMGYEMSYVLTQTIIFLSMCELLLLNIKKIILYNILTECTLMQIN